jgi:hypothetical protein
MLLRLPADLRQWLAREAVQGSRSQNAVVVEAIDLLRATRTERLADDNHSAAIELAISVARLPKSTAIMLQTKDRHLRTDILVRKPSQGNYSVLACVDGKEVVFADDFITSVAESGA